MRRIDTYKMFRNIHELEISELKCAVKDFGGAVHFGCDYVGEYASGTERPVIAVNVSKWEEGPQDVYINAVCVNNGTLSILAETKYGETFDLSPDDIEFGHGGFITDLIPERLS